MKKLLTLMFIMLVSIGMIYSQSITVTSPNGGENWDLGSTHNVTWTSSGVSGNVGIKLFQNGSSLGYIAQNVPVGSGSFSWTIGNIISVGPISAGANYQIQVKQSGVAGDMSNGNFTISPAASPAASITVTSPNGGENWDLGSTHNVTWTSSGVSGNVGIKLFQNGSSLGYIAQNVPVGSGSFSWTISNIIGGGAISAGANYQIQVKQSGVAGDMSNGNFTLGAAPSGGSDSITVTKPNSASDWCRNSNNFITWDHTGSFATVKIKLYTSADTFVTDITNSTNNDGSYSWHIATFRATGYYKIKVLSTDDTVWDFSDVFHIKSCSTLPDDYWDWLKDKLSHYRYIEWWKIKGPRPPWPDPGPYKFDLGRLKELVNSARLKEQVVVELFKGGEKIAALGKFGPKGRAGGVVRMKGVTRMMNLGTVPTLQGRLVLRNLNVKTGKMIGTGDGYKLVFKNLAGKVLLEKNIALREKILK